MVASLARIGCRLLLTALAVLGCGGKALKNDGDPSSGATGTGGSGSQGGSGNAASGGGGASGGHTGGKCEGLSNETGPQLTVLLRNNTHIPIYIGPRQPTCGLGNQVYTVLDASGMELRPPEVCTQTCQDVMQSAVPICPPIACPVSAVITLQPSEAAVQSWTAAQMETVAPPAMCRPPADDTTECDRVASVKPGGFIFTAQAGTNIDCSQFSGACGKCTPDSNGGCTTYGALIAGPLISTKLDIMLGPSYGVDGPGGGGMPYPIDIVFN